MTEYARQRAAKRKPPTPDKKPKRPISRQKLKRMNEDAVYNAIRDCYLEANPACCWCNNPAEQVHHIVSGTAGRRRSLLNSDTWLPVCAVCHDWIAGVSWELQTVIKQGFVKSTIERLRK